MSAAPEVPKGVGEEALAQVIKVAREVGENQAGARAMAATPEGRESLMSLRHEFARQIGVMQKAVKALTAADRTLDKALKAKRWGIRA